MGMGTPIPMVPMGIPWEWDKNCKLHGNGTGNGNEDTGIGNMIGMLFPCLASRMKLVF